MIAGVIQLTTPAILNRIAGVNAPIASCDEILTSMASVANQLYNGMVQQGAMVMALQDRCQRVEEAAVPTGAVEGLRCAK